MKSTDIRQLYERILLIRTFEELVLDLFRQNKLSGTPHTYIGEEATAASLMQFVGEADFVFSNHGKFAPISIGTCRDYKFFKWRYLESPIL